MDVTLTKVTESQDSSNFASNIQAGVEECTHGTTGSTRVNLDYIMLGGSLVVPQLLWESAQFATTDVQSKVHDIMCLLSETSE